MVKAIDRCVEQFQGDRCRLPAGHSEVHRSQFNVWGADGKVIRIHELTGKRFMTHKEFWSMFREKMKGGRKNAAPKPSVEIYDRRKFVPRGFYNTVMDQHGKSKLSRFLRNMVAKKVG